MKIAVTSQNYRTITPHAGKTRRFLVFEVTPDGEIVETGRLDLDRMMVMHEFRGSGGAHPLDQMDVLITSSAGAGLVRKLHARGVQVVVTGEVDPFRAIIDMQKNQIKPPAPHSCSHGHSHSSSHHGQHDCRCND